MTVVEALSLALSKETQSLDLYNKLANEHPEIRDLLTSLANEEYKHKKMIEEKIGELRR